MERALPSLVARAESGLQATCRPGSETTRAQTQRRCASYQWELQKRGLWHLHFVVGLETAVERVWASEYVAAMRELAPRYGFGFVDGKPLRRPERAERVAGYVSKYLA